MFEFMGIAICDLTMSVVESSSSFSVKDMRIFSFIRMAAAHP